MPKQAETTILLIEDTPDHAELVRRACKRSRDKYRLVVADCGSSAAAFLGSINPALILCDYLLPDCTGLSLLNNHIKKRFPSRPFVLLASQGDETIAVEAMKAGATD